MSETRKYRTFTPEQTIEIVLAGLRGDWPTRDVCREHEISEALFNQWRERLLEGGKVALATPRDKKPPEASELAQLPLGPGGWQSVDQGFALVEVTADLLNHWSNA